MYYVTDNVMVCPPLDGLQSSKLFALDPEYEIITDCIPFMEKLKLMAPADNEVSSVYSMMLQKVARYMNETHQSNYIVYNLFRDK